jgi:hypothetical protein
LLESFLEWEHVPHLIYAFVCVQLVFIIKTEK